MPRMLGLIVLLAPVCSIAAPPDRDKVAEIQSLDVLRVEAPPIQVMNALQAYAKSPLGGGAIPVLIAEGQDKTVARPPAIPDLGELVAEGLWVRLGQEVSWWPKMSESVTLVEADHVHASGASLWVAIVDRYEIAPRPFRTVFATAEVSLRDAANQPLWTERMTFSGVVHDGEKIDVDQLAAGDATLLRAELERAAGWLVTELLAEIQKPPRRGRR